MAIDSARLRAEIAKINKVKQMYESMVIQDVSEGLWDDAKIRIDRILELQQRVQTLEILSSSLTQPSQEIQDADVLPYLERHPDALRQNPVYPSRGALDDFFKK